MSAQKSGNNIVLTAGTEASPTSIETMVTAINDVAFIEQADHIITLKGGHHIDFANFFLQVPSHITLIMHGRFLSMNSTTCGLILEGGCRVQIETAWGGDAGGIRRGALIAKEYNGQYPTIILNAGRTDFPTVSYSNYTPADVVFKFILSLNDNAGVRECFGKFRFMEVTTRYTVTAGKSVPARELLISNYDLKQEG